MVDTLPAPVLVSPKLFDAILSAEKNLVVLAAPDQQLALLQLRQLAMRGGQSMYAWEPDLGISPMRDASDHFTTTQRLGDALRHVQRSRHFGVYVFVDVDTELKPEHAVLLRSISEGDGDLSKKLVFLGAGFKPPPDLLEAVEYLRCNDQRHTSIRLRDGKWGRG